jgi:hypothetical protein
MPGTVEFGSASYSESAQQERSPQFSILNLHWIVVFADPQGVVPVRWYQRVRLSYVELIFVLASH